MGRLRLSPATLLACAALSAVLIFVIAPVPSAAVGIAAASAARAQGRRDEGLASRTNYTVLAARQPLTTNPASPVAHDTELDALVSHAGRLFASTDQWEYDGRSPSGQILVKDTREGPWRLFEQTQGLRVETTMDSFPVPADQGLGRGHSLLITAAVVDGHPELQWLLDRANSFPPSDSFGLPSDAFDTRSFATHESGGVWAVYAGVDPTGILRGVWSKRRHTLLFSRVPELTVAAPGSPGQTTQKVTGFANCAGALYASISTKLFRRNDGPLPRGVARWMLVYQAPPAGAYNSGLRGLTCVEHRGSPALLVSTEGNGNVYRFDHLPRGQLRASASAGPAHGLTGLHPILEFSPIPALRHMLAKQGTVVPASGKGQIIYVIAAYNNFETVRIGGVERQLFGVEHAYLGGCPPTRTCGPTAFGVATFDAAACFAIRTDRGRSVSYSLRCLGGRSFTPSAHVSTPIDSGQAFVSIRTIVPSPFGDDRLYFGGYDCNFYPADGTAWVGSSPLAALHLGER